MTFVIPSLQVVFGLLLGYAIGSVPLGALLIRTTTGRDPRDVNPHMLGVENVFRLLGAPLAVGTFALDVFKGFLPLAIGLPPPWVALGLYVGHLYPWPRLGWSSLPRGRGNGVLLGILAGMTLFGGVPWWSPAAAAAVFGALLAATRWVALATLVGVSVWTVGVFIAVLAAGYTTDAGVAVLAIVISLLALWRQKASLARMRDGLETKLGEPPPVRGMNPNEVLAAFMVHPFTVEDLYQQRSQAWLKWLDRQGWLSESLLRRLLLHVRPFHAATLSGVTLEDGRQMRVMLIVGAMMPDQIRAYPDIATRMAVQGARFARELGAEAFGLGAFWSTVGDKGSEVQDEVPEIAITNGGAYTAGTVRAAVPGLLDRFAEEGGSLGRATAAVVGANGVVAFGVARMIVSEVGRLILIGRDAERLERSANTLRRKYPECEIVTSTDVGVLAEADLVFTATSDPDHVVGPDDVKPGAWIFDLGRPADVDPAVRSVPGVHLIPGGVVKPPGQMVCDVDIHFGEGMVPACLAETMIMTATRAFDRKSLGPRTRTADIEFYLREGDRLGFEIVTRDPHMAPLEPVA